MTTTSLDGRVAIVTGGTRGLGAAIAGSLAAAGVRVGVNYRTDDAALHGVLDAIAASGGTAFGSYADVAHPEQVAHMVDEVVARYGRLDIMVANAGLQKDAPLLDMTLEDWNATMAVDLAGTFLCLQAAARAFTRQGMREGARSAGNVVVISSVHQVIPWAGHANYAAAKGGVEQLVRTAAQELARARIRVNAIAPGAIRTDINRAVWSDPEKYRRLLELVPYGRIGEPDDVAAAVAYLASDAADYVTGATLFVDGGMSLFPSFRDNG